MRFDVVEDACQNACTPVMWQGRAFLLLQREFRTIYGSSEYFGGVVRVWKARSVQRLAGEQVKSHPLRTPN